ncbi:MAG: hypothetical protein ACJ77E_00870 [Gaiellaceae bacterium]
MTTNLAPLGIGLEGVTTSLFAGHCVPSRSNCLFGFVVGSSGEHAGGKGLLSGPPTGLSSPAACARGSGSFWPLGSPG